MAEKKEREREEKQRRQLEDLKVGASEFCVVHFFKRLPRSSKKRHWATIHSAKVAQVPHIVISWAM